MIDELRQTPETGRRRRWIVWLLLMLLGAAAAYAATAGSNKTAPTAIFQTEPAIRGDLLVTVTATGNLEPTNQVEVGSEISGTVRTVTVEDNDRVTVGQVLARIDTAKIEAQIRMAEAALCSARAKILQARATVTEAKQTLARYERVRALSANQTPSDVELDAARAAKERAEADEAAARAAVAEAEAQLDAYRTDLSKSTIASPVAGVVLLRSVEPGQTVAASLQAPVLFTLAEDLTQMELHVDVDEADVGRVAEGQTAAFTVDAWPDRTFQARILRVRYGSETTDGVVTYEAVLTVDNADGALRPGMTATAEITTAEVKDALLVPNAALRFSPAPLETEKKRSGGLIGSLLPRPPGRKRSMPAARGGIAGDRIWIMADGQPRPVPVDTGPSDGIRTVVRSDALTTGTPVVVGRRSAGS